MKEESPAHTILRGGAPGDPASGARTAPGAGQISIQGLGVTGVTLAYDAFTVQDGPVCSGLPGGAEEQPGASWLTGLRVTGSG